MKILVWAVRFAILLVLVWFSVKNAGLVTLHAYPWTWEAPLVLIILAFFGGGVVLGLLASLSTIWKLRREVKSLNKALKARDNAVATLAQTNSQSTGVGPHGV
ncbi:MAG: LapA family protein [Betaproteobacteria bacterium]|nr:LapA family protein [Betaproteobacteria bacterium]